MLGVPSTMLGVPSTTLGVPSTTLGLLPHTMLGVPGSVQVINNKISQELQVVVYEFLKFKGKDILNRSLESLQNKKDIRQNLLNELLINKLQSDKLLCDINELAA